LAQRRLGAAEALAGRSVPTAESDVWRYSPIEDLDLDTYAPARAADNGARSRAGVEARALARALGGVSALATSE
jgi:hypothetical protein